MKTLLGIILGGTLLMSAGAFAECRTVMVCGTYCEVVIVCD